MKKKKCSDVSEIYDMLIKEKSYLSVLLGHCENNREYSETIADIHLVLSEICKQHEALFDSVDSMIIELGR